MPLGASFSGAAADSANDAAFFSGHRQYDNNSRIGIKLTLVSMIKQARKLIRAHTRIRFV